MRSSIIAACGHREQKRKIKDGQCRDCRGVERKKQIHDYVSQKTRLQSDERLAHDEQYNRQRIIQNDR